MVADISTKHHEQNPSIQKTFAKDVLSLVSTIEDMGNPFLEDRGDIVTSDTKIIMPKEVVNTINIIEELSDRQYNNFVKERLQNTENDKPLSDIVSKNKLPLFSTPHTKVKSKSQKQFASLKTNCTLFGRLYIACQTREGNLDNFLEHENQPYPPSLSDMGILRQGTKSDLVDCLAQCSPSSSNPPDVLDGPAIVHMLKLRGDRTFKDYADHVFLPYINTQMSTVSRLDICQKASSNQQESAEQKVVQHNGKEYSLKLQSQKTGKVS